MLKRELGEISTDQILFFDDIQHNIDTALKFGIKAFLYTNRSQFEKDMEALNFQL